VSIPLRTPATHVKASLHPWEGHRRQSDALVHLEEAFHGAFSHPRLCNSAPVTMPLRTQVIPDRNETGKEL